MKRTRQWNQLTLSFDPSLWLAEKLFQFCYLIAVRFEFNYTTARQRSCRWLCRLFRLTGWTNSQVTYLNVVTMKKENKKNHKWKDNRTTLLFPGWLVEVFRLLVSSGLCKGRFCAVATGERHLLWLLEGRTVQERSGEQRGEDIVAVVLIMSLTDTTKPFGCQVTGWPSERAARSSVEIRLGIQFSKVRRNKMTII